MKNAIVLLLILLPTITFCLVPLDKDCCADKKAGGKCVGSANCGACKNCSACKYCVGGNTCGVCAGKRNSLPLSESKKTSNSTQCQAITKKGTQCSRAARSGGYCWQHGGR